MDYKKIMRDYHKIIVSAGIGAGLLAAIDATDFYDIGFSQMNSLIQWVLIIIIVLAGFVYYDLFWNTKFRPKTPSPKSIGQGQINSLEDINPPEMGGVGG